MRRALFALVFLASCGPLNDRSGNPGLLDGLTSAVFGGDNEAAEGNLPPAFAEAGPGNVLLVTLRARGQATPMIRSGQNGTHVTWKNPENIAMTFSEGILISTRGLGDDLMGADVPGLRSALENGSGTTMRKHAYLDSVDNIVLHELRCEVANEGFEDVTLVNGTARLTKITEDCKGPRLVFKNTYWMRAGEIVKSRQAISASQGFIDVEFF